MADLDNVMSKIKKCLALSASSNPHEAAAAMRQAQKLMEMHNISEGALSMSEIDEKTLRSATSVSRVNPWELRLMNIVAKAFGCKLMWYPGSSYGRTVDEIYGRFLFVGLKQQVPVAVYTAQVLLKKLVKARAEHVRTSTMGYDRQFKAKSADSFCLGWIFEIGKTVSAFAGDDKAAEAIDRYITDKSSGKESKAKKQKELDSRALQAGKSQAAGESLYRPMQTRGDQLKLGV